MTSSKKHDIKLSHANVSLALNNLDDVNNIDRVLSLIIDSKKDQDRLIEILNNTSMKYLKRLQEDGLIKDSNGPDVIPIYDPEATEKAVSFYQNGGYLSLYEKDNNDSMSSRVFKNFKKLLIGIVIGLIVWLLTQFVLLPLL